MFEETFENGPTVTSPKVFFRIRDRGASSIDIHAALYEMLKRDEVVTTRG